LKLLPEISIFQYFFSPGSATILISIGLLYFLLNQAHIKEKTIKLTIFYSSIVFSFISILALSGILAKIPQLPSFMKVSTFNTEGSLIPAIIFMITVLPIAIKNVIEEKQAIRKVSSIVTSIFVTSGIILSLFNIFTDKNIRIVISDFSSSWSIAMESLKQNPLLGMGPGNYQTAFNKFKPVTYNNTENWMIKFTNARSFYLTILTETGLLGLAASILILITSFNISKKNFKNKSDSAISLTILLILMMIFPSSITLIMLLAILLSLNSEKKDFDLNLTLKGQEEQKGSFILTRLPSLIVTLPILVGLILFTIQGIKTVHAEVTFKKAIDSLTTQESKSTYEYLQKAIKINPYIDRYRTSFSQVSFGLANSLARQQDLTDEDRQTIAQLIQQSINEGKAGVFLNQEKSENWTNLASIYQAIIPFAQGADQFAIETYSQAVVLDPINPLTRIALGGVYYSLGRYDEALRAFELAVIAKPDYANAHYNLAIALKGKGEIEKAIKQMELVLSLVDKESADYEVAKKELEVLESRKLVTEPEVTENLVPPQGAQEPVLKPPLELPEEATPPISTP